MTVSTSRACDCERLSFAQSMVLGSQVLFTDLKNWVYCTLTLLTQLGKGEIQ